ncbi:lipid IV(A) 3-deoxy-D-manno-octulosonic acid transferase [Neisseria shayeganii]|uniref:3-deoxy-D-manno-octulosonic acid transferase n=1 Tax=Neisseria shayeganii 871 TaxID=1032488 RepID=G4CHR2_9NEIS|nr:lipid IV(A) 3-deoxy-D-manno-octulosonic acid transferase [Neisseria shayeganii]EGY52641.1 3-deoxy-manno-octulosonate cytidylyltransferase [Neisseria shayeganii 871]
MTPLFCLYRLLTRAFGRPLARHLLRKRSRRSPDYLLHQGERFGEPPADPLQNAIWIHAVSVGETRAAQPLVAELQRHFPDAPLLLTQMTPTGRAAAEQLFPQAQCRYLPYDHPAWTAAFLAQHRPRFGILMETEIWPNLIHACRQTDLPLFLANARLSEKSARGYRRWPGLFRPAMQGFCRVLAQSEADARRLAELGAATPLVCGNSKYDLAPPAAMHALAAQFRQRIGPRPVVVCASTREHQGQDEAELLLQQWRAYRGDALLVIVPRHPERFQNAFDTAQALGLRAQKRSDETAVAADTQVWIGDSMGELFAYYLAADMAFVGGSLVDTGCQNIIEPIACGKPALFGYSTYNFAAACAGAVAAGAALQVATPADWYAAVCRWLADPAERQRYAAQAAGFIQAHQGASRRMAEAIAAALPACAANRQAT